MDIKRRDLYLDMANWSEMNGHYQLADRLRWKAINRDKLIMVLRSSEVREEMGTKRGNGRTERGRMGTHSSSPTPRPVRSGIKAKSPTP